MKVYACPQNIEYTMDYGNYDPAKEEANERAHKAKLVEWLRANGYRGKLTGEEFGIPHADGAARYMVGDGSSMVLIHLPYGDAWNSPHAQRMLKKDVIAHVQRNKIVRAVFAKKAAAQ